MSSYVIVPPVHVDFNKVGKTNFRNIPRASHNRLAIFCMSLVYLKITPEKGTHW